MCYLFYISVLKCNEFLFTFYSLENKKCVGYNIKADISLKIVIRRK